MTLKNARHLDAHPGVLRDALRDGDVVVPAELDAVHLDVAASAQLDGEDELQRRERGHLCDEAADRGLDQRLGVFARHRDQP